MVSSLPFSYVIDRRFRADVLRRLTLVTLAIILIAGLLIGFAEGDGLRGAIFGVVIGMPIALILNISGLIQMYNKAGFSGLIECAVTFNDHGVTVVESGRSSTCPSSTVNTYAFRSLTHVGGVLLLFAGNDESGLTKKLVVPFRVEHKERLERILQDDYRLVSVEQLLTSRLGHWLHRRMQVTDPRFLLYWWAAATLIFTVLFVVIQEIYWE